MVYAHFYSVLGWEVSYGLFDEGYPQHQEDDALLLGHVWLV